MSNNVDGGKICRDCGGKCCKGCALSFGYFTGTRGYEEYRINDEKSRLTQEERETISTVKDTFLDIDGNRLNLVKKFAKLVGATWDNKKGFNGPNGCTIPREKRSWVCRSYYCSELQKSLGISNKYWNEPQFDNPVIDGKVKS